MLLVLVSTPYLHNRKLILKPLFLSFSVWPITHHDHRCSFPDPKDFQGIVLRRGVTYIRRIQDFTNSSTVCTFCCKCMKHLCKSNRTGSTSLESWYWWGHITGRTKCIKSNNKKLVQSNSSMLSRCFYLIFKNTAYSQEIYLSNSCLNSSWILKFKTFQAKHKNAGSTIFLQVIDTQNKKKRILVPVGYIICLQNFRNGSNLFFFSWEFQFHILLHRSHVLIY